VTKKATIKQADLMRMAKVAKEFGVVVWQEVDGVKYCVGPSIATDPTSTPPREPATLKEWQEEREAHRRREVRKKKLPDDFRL
jgi:hypothetical protein